MSPRIISFFLLMHSNLYMLCKFVSFSILRVSKPGQVVVPFDESETQAFDGEGTECEPVSVLPRNAEEVREAAPSRLVWRPAHSHLHALSSISSIQLIGRSDNSHHVKRALYPLCLKSFAFSLLIG